MTNPSEHDPSRVYPPSRPTFKMLIAAAAVVAVAVAFLNWPRLSALAHVSQIESTIEHVIGL